MAKTEAYFGRVSRGLDFSDCGSSTEMVIEKRVSRKTSSGIGQTKIVSQVKEVEYYEQEENR